MRTWLIDIPLLVISIIHPFAATAVTLHAVLRKRETSSVIAWVGLAWLAPVVGPIAYLVLGINRIQRTGTALNLREAWKHSLEAEVLPEDVERFHAVRFEHPTLPGLEQVGRRATQNPLLPGNEIELLVNGDEAYPAMLDAIEKAQVSVSLLSYIFDSDRAGEAFRKALLAAQERGVEVRVLIDHVGSRYSKPTMVQRLRADGIPVGAFLKGDVPGQFRFSNLRNHRKILVVDGKTGFTGGTNIREGHCLDWNPAEPVQCAHFQIRGPVVAELQEMFAIDWAFTTGESLSGKAWFPKLVRRGPVGARGIPDGPDEDLDKMSEIIIAALSCAQRHVKIATPYFIPESDILRALKVTAMRGVAVDVVLPSQNNIAIVDWAATPQFPDLIAKGVRIHLSPPPFDHTKLFTIDGIWSLIGSTNWDARSLRLNFEYNLECYDDELAQRLETLIDDKIAGAQRLTEEKLARRPFPIQLRDGLARLLSPYL